MFGVLDAAGCGTNSCHGGVKPAQKLDLSSSTKAYAALVNRPSTECGSRLLVQPGAPDSSYLIHKVTGTQLCSGSKMPKTGSGLSAVQIETLRTWIGGGAAP